MRFLFLSEIDPLTRPGSTLLIAGYIISSSTMSSMHLITTQRKHRGLYSQGSFDTFPSLYEVQDFLEYLYISEPKF